MSFASDYDQAERTLFIDKDNKLDSGKPYYRIMRAFSYVIIQGIAYIETMYFGSENVNDTDCLTSLIQNRFVAIQVLNNVDAPRWYNGDIPPVNELHMWG